MTGLLVGAVIGATVTLVIGAAVAIWAIGRLTDDGWPYQ